MTTNSPSNTYVHKRDLTFKKELIESRWLLTFLAVFILASLLDLCIGFFCVLPWLLYSNAPDLALGLALSFAVGLLSGWTLASGLTSMETPFTGRHLAKPANLHDRVCMVLRMEQKSEDVLADLDACVALNLLAWKGPQQCLAIPMLMWLAIVSVEFRVNQTDQHVHLNPAEGASDTAWDVHRRVGQ